LREVRSSHARDEGCGRQFPEPLPERPFDRILGSPNNMEEPLSSGRTVEEATRPGDDQQMVRGRCKRVEEVFGRRRGRRFDEPQGDTSTEQEYLEVR